jgi:O-antigen/teichoic acid export membrane protein
MLLKVGTGMGGVIIDMAGYTKLKLFNSILQIATLIILDVLLIPRWGLIGAAVAAVGGEGFVNILRMVEVYIIYKIIPYNISFYKPVLATLGAIATGFIANRLWGDYSNFLLAGLNMAIMAVTYLATIFILGFNQEEKDLFKIFLNKFKRKFNLSGLR